jgi:hypothetical protein
MTAGLLGQIVNPASGNRVLDGVGWCADNAVFGGGYPGDDEYLRWLSARAGGVSRCGFATAPDVVCDATATWARSEPMFEPIRALGYPVALVAQNGIEDAEIDWSRFDALFLGGDNGWKDGSGARAITARALRVGVPVHMGRVNTLGRLRRASRIGCSSVDGTLLAFGPDVNLRRLLAWLRDVEQPTLFDLAEALLDEGRQQ